jgi:dihydrofolate synthase/folylpolyglutamate synthase
MPLRSIASGSATWSSSVPGRAPIVTSLEQAERFLDGLIDHERRPSYAKARFGLEPICSLLAELGNPERGLSVVHVAGSKGKGSTALMVEAILTAAGLRVGTFTKPHLERWTERFRVDGREVAGDELARAVERLRPAVEALREAAPDRAPTWFDATTATALLVFRSARVEHVVLEVGLGGRLDSTNVVAPAVACVTSIELEHTEALGATLAAIAGEKAGILKPGRAAVVGALAPEALAVLLARARELEAPVARLGVDFDVEILDRQLDAQRVRLWDGGVEVDARIPVAGDHQARNAALALACARRLGALGEAELAGAARRGLSGVTLPGRIEVLSRAPWIIVDCAHTAASARALAESLARIPHRRSRLVVSISAGKDLPAVLAPLAARVDAIFATCAEPRRSLPPEQVADALRSLSTRAVVHCIPDPRQALGAAREGLGADDLLCATGSVFLAGIARRLLR